MPGGWDSTPTGTRNPCREADALASASGQARPDEGDRDRRASGLWCGQVAEPEAKERHNSGGSLVASGIMLTYGRPRGDAPI